MCVYAHLFVLQIKIEYKYICDYKYICNKWNNVNNS